MNIAFGHTNTDFDCLGSLMLVKKLFPGFSLIRSNRIHPAAQNIFDFYSECFDFLSPKDIDGMQIDNVIIVDTCVAGRVNEYFSHIRDSNPVIRIFDHHQTERCDILGAKIEEGRCGANTSLLGKIAMQEGIALKAEEATIALAAIYADTGRLIYENVTRDDYEVSAWLLDMGASLKLVRSFLETVREDEQIMVLNRLKPEPHSIQGNVILLSYLELEQNVAGLAAVVEKIMEIQNPDAYFAVFSIPKDNTVLLIARSQTKKIDLDALLSVYGGGGHQLAASARISGRDGLKFFEEFKSHLEQSLEPAVRAKDIMTENVFTVSETTSLMEASLFLESIEFTACPVVDKDSNVIGLISLRDIMKGRKNRKMHSPVKAYMSRPVISAGAECTIREIERIFYKYRISHLPILDEKKLLGILTRWDYLEFQKHASH